MGLVAMTVLCAVSSTAGAQTNQWSVQANGGFVSLDLLNTLQFAGGGSEADASSAPMAEASGTGACLSTAASTNPCPTSAILVAVRRAPSTARRTRWPRATAPPPRRRGASTCPVPDRHRPAQRRRRRAAAASASEDANGNPTASGTGSLANVSISLSLTDVLQTLLGGSLPSASSVCNDVPAATTHAGLEHRTRCRRPVQALLGTVNGILPANLALNPTSVAGGSDLSGECSVAERAC